MRNTMNTLTSTTLASTRTTAVGSLSLCRLSMGMNVGMIWCRQITISKGEDLI